ncbi:pyridoxamine 5'-phosphate oxidase [Sulfitobacter donghicola]|uniref:Pyridoxine/pyridoxamine 5'-phosphate oxidase n=1 Tax=Sulfitobacter donghicola DSW-25 = KCTC 12864 = JCM 14565 TaxID=1300350 RepID=A0A073IVZ8_9RHOB|nr:pyridoxamine 5'-phosphate oxidase [Sulfitobacter donghicola]KEJ89512.1 pyridoxamine 5'-phosphate oxidase [Sulfitobacter donghicola DSW-25 = KCTC 12864 = JCM 14565]KIN69335.1 Pyridoxine/pyridoxamine 5'-phosphate oxidase [Sulfitobacter donghicola DSW-25 = KCTC 12864 = JCM 14565]
MAERTGIFAGDDPFALARTWLAEARTQEINDSNAMALSSVDAEGMPNVRIVLLKSIEDNGFVFFTNYGSVKAQELDQSGKAAFVIHWKTLRRQIRARGIISREDGPIADEYYASRSLKSRLGAWASDQSQPLENRAALENALAKATAEHGDNPPRPPFWGGYRLAPLELEFWGDGEARLHNRFRWRRASIDAPWDVTLLNP